MLALTLCVLALPTASVLAATPAAAPAAVVEATDKAPYVRLKRAVVLVPDIARAIVFYRDVLGFSLEARGEVTQAGDSALFELYDLPASTTLLRARFASSTEAGALVVVQVADSMRSTPPPSASPATTTLVVQTTDLAALVERARVHGFASGTRYESAAFATGGRLFEASVYGPGDSPVLVYQLAPVRN